MMATGLARGSVAALCCALSLSAAGAPAKHMKPADAMEPARAALRTLQFDKAIALLGSAANAGNGDAQYLLGLIYLNGVGVVSDAVRGRALLQTAAEHGQAAAAYVLAGELAHDPSAPAGSARQWLERSAELGYVRAVEAEKSGRPLLDREFVGASDPSLLTAWVMDSARKNDAAELRRLGPASAAVRDEFGRGSLSHAAAAGSLAAATALLELGADVGAVDEAGTTALMIAAERPDEAMAGLLLQHGADPKSVDAQKRTAVFYAARANRAATIGLLQRAGAVLDMRDSRGYNALDAALVVGADAAVVELRSLGVRANLVTVDPGRQSGKFDPAHPGEIYRGWSPLALAVSRNDTVSLRQQLDAGGDANLRTPQGDSLLQIAAHAHALDSVSLLLARGAISTATDHGGHTVLWRAAIRNDVAIVKVLLGAGVAPDAHGAIEQTPLLAALRATHSDVAQLLLAAGANPEIADAQGHTPLMLTCASGDITLVKLLLERRAGLDAADHEHRTALWYAAAAGSREEMALLLAAGARPEAVDARGLTVLHAAAQQGGAGVIGLLLASDTHVNRRDTAGNTPLMIAAATGHVEVVQALLARSPELDVQNTAGDTALIAASRGGYTAICHLLVAAGANRALRNIAGVSAGDVAAGRGFASITTELSGKS
ncbi:MAG: ankyrin [Gammaproteobacteria bacterium]|nr:ankyrin [Gammaproteobacteria bacterium]